MGQTTHRRHRGVQADEDRRPDALPPALARRTGFLLSKAADRARGGIDRALAPMGMKRRYFGVLTLLAAEGPSSQQALGERLRVDRSTMTLIADELERLGLAERRRNPVDRRAHDLTITDGGREMLDRLEVVTATVEDAFLAPLSAAERRQLHDLLMRLVDPTPAATSADRDSGGFDLDGRERGS